MAGETPERLDIHVAATFLAIDPDRGSEAGNGWSWLEQISRHVTNVTAVVTPESAVRLGGDVRVPANVRIVAPSSVPRMTSRLPIPAYYLDYASAHVAMSRVVSLLDADIYHQVTLGTPYWGTDLDAARGARLLGPVGISRPAPLWAVQFLGRSDTASEWARRLLSSYRKPPVAAEAAIRAADHVLAVDAATERRARRLRRATTRFMADGAHPATSDALIGPERREALVWAGRMMPRKGCVLAVRAFAAARSRLPGTTRFVIIGDGPEHPSVAREVRALGLQDRVDLLGALPRSEVLERIGCARALVFSSLRDTFGGVVLEAAERATPTVWASHPGVDGLRDWFPGDAGWSRPATSARGFVSAIAEGMVAAAGAPEPDWMARSAAAHGFAIEHDWNRRGREMAGIYQRMLGIH